VRTTDIPHDSPPASGYPEAFLGVQETGGRSTSKFSREAKLASYKKGAITVLLLDGRAVADLLVERGIGVRRMPVHLYDIDDEFFDFDEEE
jgi:restriction system protein